MQPLHADNVDWNRTAMQL